MTTIRLLTTIVVLSLTGCVLWKDAKMAADADSQTLTFSNNAAGLLPGMCGFQWGKGSQERGAIYLSGDKEKYTESDFFIVQFHTKPVTFYKNVKGTIRVDRKEQVVFIDVSIDGTPCANSMVAPIGELIVQPLIRCSSPFPLAKQRACF